MDMGFPRQAHWSGLPFPSPGDLDHPGIKPRSPAFQADSLPSEPPGKPSESLECTIKNSYNLTIKRQKSLFKMGKIWIDTCQKKIHKWPVNK